MSPHKTPSDDTSRQKLLGRLRTVEGHLRGVIQMVESDAYCIDVLQQTKAVHAALAKIEGILLDRHLHHCVTAAVKSEKRAERERVIGELLDVFEARRRG